MSSHFPVDHHLRPLYRFLSAVAGIYVLVFGIVGISRSSGHGLFDRPDITALGLRTNLGFAIASVVVGAAVLISACIGRNVIARVATAAGSVFMVVGLAMLAVLRTDLNVLNSTIITVIVSFSLGIMLFTGGLYMRSSNVRA